MQLSWCLLMLVTQHVSGIIMPIVRSTVKDDKPHTVFCTGRAEWTWGDEVDPVCAWWVWLSYNHTHQVHTASTSSPQGHSARPVQNSVCGLSSFTVLLMMGTMMPETCWVTNINKLQINCILLVLSSHYTSTLLRLWAGYIRQAIDFTEACVENKFW
jgi:hypothetical protein